MTFRLDIGAGGGYMGSDHHAQSEFQRIADNFAKLRMVLEETGIIPSLLAKITGVYSTGYPWSEVVEESDGTFTVISGGRASGTGIYPKAFEKNGGQAAITNAIVSLELSNDPDTGELTACFDGKGARVAADDFITPTSLAFDIPTRVLTIGRLTAQRDIFGRVMGTATPANLTVEIPAGTGAFDAYQDGTIVEADVTRIDITGNGSENVLEFVDDSVATQVDLRLKSTDDYKVPIYNSGWTLDYPRFH